MRISTLRSHLLSVTAIATACAYSVSAFQPGSDYDLPRTANLYNCSGDTALSNVTVPNAANTLPQLDPTFKQGWEQWSLFLHGTFPTIVRWNRGDPSSNLPSLDRFDLLVLNVDGTTVQGSIVGELSYANGEKFKRIAIGRNSLTWDSAAQWFNVSVDIDGYQLKMNLLAEMYNEFRPNVAFHNGMLDHSGGWFSSVPSIRSQVSKDSSLHTPQNQTIPIDGLVALKHMFSERPLPDYINKYYAGTAWGYSTTFYDSHVFYQTETINGTVHDATYLGRALATPGVFGLFSSIWATYAFTDNHELYSLAIDPNTKQFNATFSGCTSTNNIPYVFNINTTTLLGEFTDLGGGRTSYFSVNGSTTAPFNGSVANGAVQGYFEEYHAPSTVA